jgi:hypothetical protein
VTAKAERKVLQFVRRFRREHPDGELLFTGCSARHPEIGRRYEEAGARVFGFHTEALDWLRASLPPEPATVVPGEPPRPRARAFINVQDVQLPLRYCIIPQVAARSARPAKCSAKCLHWRRVTASWCWRAELGHHGRPVAQHGRRDGARRTLEHGQAAGGSNACRRACACG